MKFGDLLKTIGIVNKVPRNMTAPAGNMQGPMEDFTTPAAVDRFFNVFQKHQQMSNPYLVHTGFGGSAPPYNSMVHNIPGQRGYGLKLGPGGGGHHGYDPNAYGPPPPPHGVVGGGAGYHGPQVDHSSYSRHKSKDSSAMTALTLLSFFFFINLLQNCLKEHMDTINPTVMVMTTGVARIRGNKIKGGYHPAVSKEESFGGSDPAEVDIDEMHRDDTPWKRVDSKRKEEGGGKIITRKDNHSDDSDNERFSYRNRTLTQTKPQTYHQFHTKQYATRDRTTEHKQQDFRTKFSSDFPKDEDSSYFTRIY